LTVVRAAEKQNNGQQEGQAGVQRCPELLKSNKMKEKG